jgi:hypothetical protein
MYEAPVRIINACPKYVKAYFRTLRPIMYQWFPLRTLPLPSLISLSIASFSVASSLGIVPPLPTKLVVYRLKRLPLQSRSTYDWIMTTLTSNTNTEPVLMTACFDCGKLADINALSVCTVCGQWTHEGKLPTPEQPSPCTGHCGCERQTSN